jgi:hypothetical protein
MTLQVMILAITTILLFHHQAIGLALISKKVNLALTFLILKKMKI